MDKKGKKSTPEFSPAAFRRVIRDYYRKAGRVLPWRTTRDPYAIFVSECMLQQTQVVRVLPKYASFLKRFPSFEALALAPLSEVLREWQGLGYNRRARALHEAAKRIVTVHGGSLPKTRSELESLPGVGPYTAGALLSFAFNSPVPCIETNIRNVYLHFFFRSRRKVRDSEILSLIEKTLDRKNPRDWFYALMDYGAYLKATGNGLNKKSTHYVKQKAFEGSRRQLRGFIVRLAGTPKGTLPAIARASGRTLVETRTEALRLAAEGMVVLRGKRVMLPD